MQTDFSIKNRLKVVDGKRIRIGPIPKTEISSSMGMTHKYVWCQLIHKNKMVMKRIVSMGYRKNSRFISRKIARFLAKHFDIYVEGVNEEDMETDDALDKTSDIKRL